jgi:hypothetical protein
MNALTSVGFPVMDKMQIARYLAEAKYTTGWRPKRLLSRANTKLMKAERNIGLSLSPAVSSGFQVCASASPECIKHCINTSGLAAPHLYGPHIWVGRITKTLWFFRDRPAFMEKLFRDIALNQSSAIRLNVFSDWMWERQAFTVNSQLSERYGVKAGTYPSLIDAFPDTQFYDYTKHFKRMFRMRPQNYHLTFSLTENNQHEARQVLAAGMNVAAVTATKTGTLFGYPILDGDENDLRFLDPPGKVIGLKPKGSLRNLESEFLYDPRWSAAEAA